MKYIKKNVTIIQIKRVKTNIKFMYLITSPTYLPSIIALYFS